jgi:hypothetical protein
VFGLYGCSQSATSVFNKDPIYAQNIQYTKIAKVIQDNNVVAIFNITYLNSTSSKWNNNKQNFLIGLYCFNKDNNDFDIMMNDQNATEIQTIGPTDPLYKNIAFKNHWATYKVFTFEDSDDLTLVLKITNPKFQDIAISFQKE